MPYQATVYNVMIASPGDVEQERRIARDVIYNWNSIHSANTNIILQPIGWETHSHPESGDNPQAFLNKQILENADLLIGIFWTRIGTPTDEAESGTAEEIEKHIKAGKPAMLYFSNKDIKPQKIDNEQYEKVKAFKKKYSNKSLYHEFSTIQEFEKNLHDHLALKVNSSTYFKRVALSNEHSSTNTNEPDSGMPIRELLVMNILANKNEQSEVAIQVYLKENGLSNLDCHAAISSLAGKGFIRQTNTNPVSYNIFPRGYQWAMRNKNLFDHLNSEALSDEAKELLVEASKSPDGKIMKLKTMRGLIIQTNNKGFVGGRNARLEAIWEDALNQLIENSFVEDRGYKGEVFAVTRSGYEYADQLIKESPHE